MITFASLTLIPILIAYVFSVWSRQKIVVWLPTSFMLISLWVLVFGMANKLMLGLQLVVPCLLFISLFTIYFRRDLITAASIKESISPALTLFIAISAFTFIQTQNMKFYLWDEFSGWGQFVKSMFLFDALGPFSPAKIGFAEYLSGISILPYLTVKVGGIWDEADVYWSYQIFIISILISTLGLIQWKKFSMNLLVITSSLLVVTFYFNSFQSIYADPLLGLLFGLGIVIGTSREIGNDRWTFINFMVVVCFISTIKEIGFYFSFTLIFLMFVVACIRYSSTRVSNYNVVFRSLLLALIAATPVILFKLSWELTLIRQLVVTDRSILSIAIDLVRNNPIGETNYLDELTSEYTNKVFSQPLTVLNGYPLTIIAWLLIFTLLWILLIKSMLTREEKIKEIATFITLIFGTIGYLTILWISYVVVFTSYEGVKLASFDRYFFTYFLGIILYLQYKFIHLAYASPISRESKAFISVWVVFLMLQSTPGHILSYLSNPSAASDGFMSQYSDQRKLIHEFNLNVEDDIWIISQHTIGFEYYFFKYEMLPASVGSVAWSMGTPFGDNDIWTDKKMTPEIWNELLNDYDYVYLYKWTDSYINEFGEMYSDLDAFTTPGFFKVVNTESGNKLVRIENK